jgi:cysteine desulfurase
VTLSIYLDYQASTPIDPRVISSMAPWLGGRMGNPHSIHHEFGRQAAQAIADAQSKIAGALGVMPEDIIFTSGATEANNLALHGLARADWPSRPRLVAPQTEHKSVLEPLLRLATDGFELDVLPVDSDGLIDLSALEHLLKRGRAIVSVMTANSEIGVLQPMAEIGALCRRYGAFLHTDASQALGKVPLDLEGWQVDVATFSGHKIYGPMGVGALVAPPKLRRRMVPVTVGGGQQDGLRPGTVPTFLSVGLAEAVHISVQSLAEEAREVSSLSKRLFVALQEGAGVQLNGSCTYRLPGNLNLCFPGVDALTLITLAHGVAISTGSACASTGGEVAPSHVLRAIGLDDAAIRSSVRISLGRFTTPAEVEEAAAVLITAARAGRAATRGQPVSAAHCP